MDWAMHQRYTTIQMDKIHSWMLAFNPENEIQIRKRHISNQSHSHSNGPPMIHMTTECHYNLETKSQFIFIPIHYGNHFSKIL